ncbi:MAG: HIT family protein [Dehalococcoidales bacterium]|nr:HIT family protein [Dehalococcoidales bacterium]
MEYEELRDFLLKKMRLSHIYQPLLIKTLVEANGKATTRQLARAFLAQDEKQLEYYEERLVQMPIPVLSKHGIITREGDMVSLNTEKLNLKQQSEIKKICEEKIQDFIASRGLDTWKRGNVEAGEDDVNYRQKDCIFCNVVGKREILAENDYCLAFLDAFPVTEGHTLIIPKRHVADYFELNKQETAAINDLLHQRRKTLLDQDTSIKGFNVGVNVGHYAGQSIMHCHVHLIPRREGDNPAPKGGVRGVIPARQSY